MSAASGTSGPCLVSRVRSEMPSTSSITIAAPSGLSTYSYRPTTYGLSSPPSSRASERNPRTKPGWVRKESLRYFTATGTPVST